jgi:hypothetical protein
VEEHAVSYGRSPYYIYQGEYDDGDRYFCFMDGAVLAEDGQLWATIKYDAVAQFVASMWRRDHDLDELGNLHGELAALIERGLEVRPDLRNDAYWRTRTVKLSDTASSSEVEVTFPEPSA